MSFRVSTEQIDDVAVLQCRGRVVDPDALSRLKAAVTGLLQLRVVVLDLSGVEMVDARGLGMLVFLHNWACAKGIQVKLVNPSKLVREMLEVTRLTSVLHVSSVDDLVEMFCNSYRCARKRRPGCGLILLRCVVLWGDPHITSQARRTFSSFVSKILDPLLYPEHPKLC